MGSNLVGGHSEERSKSNPKWKLSKTNITQDEAATEKQVWSFAVRSPTPENS